MSEQPELPNIDPEADNRRALLEAIIYAAEEPLTAAQIAKGIDAPRDQVEADLQVLMEESASEKRGTEIRKVAEGYKMSTKAEHHDGVRTFVKTLRPKLKLSLPALETLAVVAYKQPVTMPEIQAVRGVNSTGVISTLLNRKLITTAGRKAVIGRPMQYKTTKDFLIQFGLSDLTELPTLKELEDLGRAALGEIDEFEETDETQDTVAEDEAQDVEATQEEESEPQAEGDSPEAEETETEAEPQDAEEPEAEGEPGQEPEETEDDPDQEESESEEEPATAEEEPESDDEPEEDEPRPSDKPE